MLGNAVAVSVISVPRTVADNLDQSDDSSGPAQIDYSEKRSLPISIPDYHTVQHAGERYVVCTSLFSLLVLLFSWVLIVIWHYFLKRDNDYHHKVFKAYNVGL